MRGRDEGEGNCALRSCLCREIELPEDDFQEKPEDESVIILDRCKGWGVEGMRCLCVACDRDALARSQNLQLVCSLVSCVVCICCTYIPLSSVGPLCLACPAACCLACVPLAVCL